MEWRGRRMGGARSPHPVTERSKSGIWMERGQELRTLAGHSDSVNGVAVTADGRRAVSASSDRTLKIWDLDGERPGIAHAGGTLGFCEWSGGDGGWAARGLRIQ